MKASEITQEGYYWYFDEDWFVVKVYKCSRTGWQGHHMPRSADAFIDYEGEFVGPLINPDEQLIISEPPPPTVINISGHYVRLPDDGTPIQIGPLTVEDVAKWIANKIQCDNEDDFTLENLENILWIARGIFWHSVTDDIVRVLAKVIKEIITTNHESYYGGRCESFHLKKEP